MVLIFLGSLTISWVIVKLWSYQKLKSWEEVECVINKAETVSDKEPHVYVTVVVYRPLFEYSYNYNGHDYFGHSISLEGNSLKSTLESENYFWSKWTQGKKYLAYVNPTDPQQAVLYRGLTQSRKSHYLALFIAGILLIIIGGLVQYIQP